MQEPWSRWEDMLISALGVWLILSVWLVPGQSEASIWNAWVIGALLAGVGVVGAVALKPGIQVVAIIFGAWLIVSPFLIGYTAAVPGQTRNDILVGALVIIVGIVRLVRRPKVDSHAY